MDRRFWFDLSEEEIVAATRSVTLERAYDYLWDDRLRETVIYRDSLGGLVQGFTGTPHRVEIRRGPPLESYCNCGAGGICRHAAAVLLAWREEPARFWALEESLQVPRDWRELYARAVLRPERLWEDRKPGGLNEAERRRLGRRPRPDLLLKWLERYRWGPPPEDPAGDRDLLNAARSAGVGPFPWKELQPLWESWLLGDFGWQDELLALLMNWTAPADRQRLDDWLTGHLSLLSAEAGDDPRAALRYRAGRLLEALLLVRQSAGRPQGLRRLLQRYLWAWGGAERLARFADEEGLGTWSSTRKEN